MSHVSLGVDTRRLHKQLLTKAFTKLRDVQYEHRYDDEDETDDVKLARVRSQVHVKLGLPVTASAKRFSSQPKSDTRTVDEIFGRLGLLEEDEK
jgi:hypothetical protein